MCYGDVNGGNRDGDGGGDGNDGDGDEYGNADSDDGNACLPSLCPHSSVCCGPGTQSQGTKCTSKGAKGPPSSPSARLPARAAVTHTGMEPILIAALRAHPRAPPPLPIAWPPLLHQLPLAATMAPLCEAQVHGVAIRANPTVSHDPFMLVQLPWLKVQ